jgi:uroporphyrinogen decarboxylase
MNQKERFLAACRSEPVDHTPVWFMRQAGRYLPGYREIRRTHSLLEIAKTPSLCEDVTIMPVKELNVDAAVIFADIMLPLEGMGVDFKIEENLGPVISNSINTIDDVEKLGPFDPAKHVGYVLQAISRVKSKIPNVGLVGFAGAPFTIASYMIEGQPSRDFTKTKRMMFNDTDTFKALMLNLSEMISEYLCAQIKAGADAVQLFDSWIGALSLEDYKTFVAPFVEEIFSQVKKEHPETPRILFGTNTSHLLGAMKGHSDVFSIDWRISITEARKILGDGVSIQGNLEPAVLLSKDLHGFIAKRSQKVLDDNKGYPGHIFNLGHGILKDTPPETAKFVVKYVQEHSLRN